MRFAVLEPPPEWMLRASCRGLNPRLFYPEEHELVDPEARRVCAACPVQRECLTHAMESGEKHGVWGGTSVNERRQIRKNYLQKIRRDREREERSA